MYFLNECIEIMLLDEGIGSIAKILGLGALTTVATDYSMNKMNDALHAGVDSAMDIENADYNKAIASRKANFADLYSSDAEFRNAYKNNPNVKSMVDVYQNDFENRYSSNIKNLAAKDAEATSALNKLLANQSKHPQEFKDSYDHLNKLDATKAILKNTIGNPVGRGIKNITKGIAGSETLNKFFKHPAVDITFTNMLPLIGVDYQKAKDIAYAAERKKHTPGSPPPKLPELPSSKFKELMTWFGTKPAGQATVGGAALAGLLGTYLLWKKYKNKETINEKDLEREDQLNNVSTNDIDSSLVTQPIIL